MTWIVYGLSPRCAAPSLTWISYWPATVFANLKYRSPAASSREMTSGVGTGSRYRSCWSRYPIVAIQSVRFNPPLAAPTPKY